MDEYNQVLAENERAYLGMGDAIEWRGLPSDAIPTGHVDVQFRNGSTVTDIEADRLRWDKGDDGYSIVRWRPSEARREWNEWHGAKKHEARPSGLVDVVLRNGTEMLCRSAETLHWKHIGRAGDIVRWRLAESFDEAPIKSDESSPLFAQVGGDHYKKLAVQPMEYSMANGLDPLQHTAIKYITRFRDKNGIEDLRKAIHTIEMLIEWETKRG
jgi:hypothetical protein